MPQMSPMWWLTLSINFTMMLSMMMSFLYFNFDSKICLKTKKNSNKMNWKW
nr:ATP synthase F0 subunit 8 [Acostemma sp.]